MLKSVRRLLDLCDARGERYHVCGDRVFRVYDRVARPFGPVAHDHTIAEREAREVIRGLGAQVLWWTDGCAEDKSSEWYAVICRDFTPLEDLPAKRRSEMRRGLRNCDVQRVDAGFMSTSAYPTYASAYDRYQGSSGPDWSETRFRDYFAASAAYDDVAHYWGAFHEGRLIAYACVNVFDDVEATYWALKIDPAYADRYAGYALLYRMNEHYLAEQGMHYANDGWRSLLHASQMQQFLIRKFGFVKSYAHMSVRYRTPLGLFVRTTLPFARVFERFDRRLAAAYALERIARGWLSAHAAEPPPSS